MWKSTYKFLKLPGNLMLVTWSEGHVASRVGASQVKSAPCLVKCLWVFRKWRYVFNLSCNLTWPRHCEVFQIYGWELLEVCHHCVKSCDHRHCDSGYIFLIVTWHHRDTCLKGYVTTLQSLVAMGIVVAETRF